LLEKKSKRSLDEGAGHSLYAVYDVKEKRCFCFANCFVKTQHFVVVQFPWQLSGLPE